MDILGKRGVALGAGLGYTFGPEILDTVKNVFSSVSDVANTGIANGLTPVLPAILGYKGMQKVMDKFDIQDKYLRFAGSVIGTIGGGASGALLTTSAAAPSLGVVGMGVAAWHTPPVVNYLAKKGVSTVVETGKLIGDIASSVQNRVKKVLEVKSWNGSDGVFA